MTDLRSKGGELHADITVTRAATGKVEHYHLVGNVTAEEGAVLEKLLPKHHTASGAMVGPGSGINNHPKG